MKVILLQNVKEQGAQGDIVEVSEGYARNFLFPQHLAIEASDEAVRELQRKEQSVKSKEKKESKAERKLAGDMDGKEIFVKVKTDNGTLFAAFTSKDVVKELKSKGWKVEHEWVRFEPVKEVGSHEAVIELPSGYEATVTFVLEDK